MKNLTLEEKQAKAKELVKTLKEINYNYILITKYEKDNPQGVSAFNGTSEELANLLLNAIERIPGVKHLLIAYYVDKLLELEEDDD